MRELKAYEHDPPINGIRFSIEANGNKRRKNEQQLHPIQFTGMTFEQLPDALDVAIYEVQTSFQPIDMVSVSKAAENSVKVLMSFSFSTWEMPESLGKFIERYVAGLNATFQVSEASCSKSEYGFDVICEANPSSVADIFRVIQDLEVTAASVYRDTIVPTEDKPKSSLPEARWQWWLRYVIVPVICSGGIAAVLANYLLQ